MDHRQVCSVGVNNEFLGTFAVVGTFAIVNTIVIIQH